MMLRRSWVVVLSGVALLAALPALAAPAGSSPEPARRAPGSPTAAPTVDRLAAPPTVTNPTQADLGAQLYWLRCQPCHGDHAQGLTDEWRAQYPPEDQNCWKSGCHGNRPYPNGFTLPSTVPALIGPGTLNRFATAAELFAFVSHAMPFQAPGSLKPEEYWAITAFLMRGHGLSDASLPISDAASAQRLPLSAPAATTVTAAPGAPSSGPAGPLALAFVAGLALVGVAGWAVWRARRRGS